MHEVLLLGIAASELTVLLTSDPRRWSRRVSLFLTLLLAVICYSWFILGEIRRHAEFLLAGRWRPSALSRC